LSSSPSVSDRLVAPRANALVDCLDRRVGGAGSLQGLLPGAPTDPGVRVKRTRFVTLRKIAVPHTTGSFRGDTLARHGILGVVPTPRPQRGTPFAPRGPEGPFPRFNATMEHCDFLTVFSPHFVSFAWRYLGASAFRPRSAADAGPTDHPGVCCTGCSRSGFLQGTARFSQVPVKPVRSFAMFSDPGVTWHACGSRCSECQARPPRQTKTRAHDDKGYFGAQSHSV
jgi:hypothetical protein